MNELACQFGPHGRLAGIVTEPAKTGGTKIGCILVSAGLVPKFGPYRLYALLARRLAQAGCTTLRFDLGSIGDSGSGPAQLPLNERTQQEIALAVDYLVSRYALDGVVLCGLCSGAEDSFRYAEKDERIRGVVMIDPFCYPTSGWYWRQFLFRLIRRGLAILRVYKPLVYPVTSGPAPTGEGGALIQYQYIPEGESSRILRGLIARKTHLHFIYTGGMRESFNHRGQLRKMFPGLDLQGRVALSHLPGMEHTPMLEEDRQTVIDLIVRDFAVAYGEAVAPVPRD